MSFGKELKDFAEGYKTGSAILSDREKNRIEAERYGAPTDANLGSGNPLAGTAPAISEATAGGGGTGSAQVSNRGGGAFIQQAYDYYRSRGLTPAHAAGIAGNLMQESGGSNDVISGRRFGDNGKSGYAGQWQGARLTNLLAFAKSHGNAKPTLQDQFDFVLEESNPKSPYAEAGAIKAFQLASQAKSADEATSFYRQHYERPSADDLSSRVSYARQAKEGSYPEATFSFDGKAAPAATAAAAPAATTETKPQEPAKPEKQARLSPAAGIPIPENQFAMVQPALVRPEDEWGHQTLFAAEGGVIPEPVDPSAVNGVDRYNRTRAYTQQIPQSAPLAPARRIGSPSPGSTPYQPMQMTNGMTPSQLAFKQMQDRAAVQPAAPAPVAAAPAAPAPRAQGSPGMMVYQPGAHGRDTYMQIGMPAQYGRSSGRQFRYEEGGVIPEVNFARGGAVPDRDTRFKELLRQESIQGDRGGGESPRDRAARRLSAEEGRASSTAYKAHSEYWQKPKQPSGGKTGGGKLPDKAPTPTSRPDPDKTSSTTTSSKPATGVRPGVISDNTPVSPLTPTSVPSDLPVMSTPTSAPSLLPVMSTPTSAPGQPPAAPAPAIPDPTGPTLGGTPTGPYELKHPPAGLRAPGTPMVYPAPVVPPPVASKPGTGAQAKPTIATTKIAPTATTARPPGPPQPQGPPAPARSTADPARRAADVADTRKRMELVTTPPSAPPANQLVPVLLNPATGEIHDPNAAPADDQGEYPDVPPQDWSGVQDQRPAIGRNLLSPLLNETGKRLFGYAAGGIIPEPGQPGYNEAVASGATAQAPVDQQTTGSVDPQERMQPTPKLMHDVSQALHHGIGYLTQHFGLKQDGAVPTPDGGQQTQDGARRFAEGEGAASQQEVDGIDNKIDPNREMSEGDRQMTRTAKVVQWYLAHGRKDDAGAAAAGLMQYGAQRFGQIGSLAATGYGRYLKSGDPADLQNTLNALKSAYSMIPDGGAMDVQMDPKTHQLVVSHTDDQGKTTNIPVKPEDLPGIIKGVQDKSAYWQQVMTLADPEGAHLRERTKVEEAQWNRTHDITRSETVSDAEKRRQQDLSDAEAAAKAESAKNERELQEQKDKEARDAAQKKIEQGATNAESDRQALRNAAIDVAKKRAEGMTDLDWNKASPLVAAVADANNADDKGTPEGKQRIDEAKSRLFDAMPDKNRADQFTKLTGETTGEFNYVAATATPMAAIGDTPPANYPGAQKGDEVKKGTGKDGKPIWVVVRGGKQFAVPAS